MVHLMHPQKRFFLQPFFKMASFLIKKIDRVFGLDCSCGHTFYGPAITPNSIVMDLGACRGDFCKYMTDQYGCLTYAIEASPELFSNIIETSSIRKYNYAIAGNDGFTTFYQSSLETAGNIMGPKANSTGHTFEIETRKLSTLMRELGLKEIDLLKIDIEGAELLLFETAEHKDIAIAGQIAIEFHDSVQLPNISTEQARRMIKKIQAAGFWGIALGTKNSNWLFVNQARLAIPSLTKTYLSIRRLIKIAI
ncbi:MAG: hypothetical protein QG657_5580 [Acidobacteriota bacterium]|nr:hypothetical protein [Acidobacteriota bacterium]